MCGIGGILWRESDRPVDPMILERLGNAIAMRGLDHVGYHMEAGVGLVHRRLSILDLSPEGHQPRLSNDKKVAIAFNGEIVNFRQLRTELMGCGLSFSSTGDTEVLLKGYLREGKDFFKRLRGFFAIAILDGRDQSLTLVRDHAGIKPLYYAVHEHGLVFASEAKAILASGLVHPIVSAVGLQDYLCFNSYLPGNTLFKGIQSLKPGHILHVARKPFHVRAEEAFWEIPRESPSRNLVYSEAVEELAWRIEECVRLWSVSDVPVGAYLSGGLDSSIVASFASRSTDAGVQDSLFTYSSVFPGAKTADEKRYSDAMAAAIHSRHRSLVLPRDEVARDHHDLFHVLDMPVAGYSAPYRTMSRAVRNDVKVVLTGHGGDEQFAGYPRYIALSLARQLSRAMRDESVTVHTSHLPYLKKFEQQARNILAKAAFADDAALIGAALDRNGSWWRHVSASFRKECRGRDAFREAAALAVCADGESDLRAMLILDYKLLLPALLHVEDRLSMAENLESRTPLLDHTITEFASTLPDDFLLRNGLKSLLRDVGRKVLPDLITENPTKSGIMYPVMELVDDELKPQAEHALDVLDAAGIFETPVRDMLADTPDLMNRRNLWTLWSLGGWVKTFRPDIEV